MEKRVDANASLLLMEHFMDPVHTCREILTVSGDLACDIHIYSYVPRLNKTVRLHHSSGVMKTAFQSLQANGTQP
jgi:hypothetical protein